MILLRRPPGASGPSAVAVFGVGLIGQAIVDALESASTLRGEVHALSWNQAAQRRRQLEGLEGLLGESPDRVGGAAGNRRRGGHLGIVWSAGRAGFDAGEEDVAGELASFRDVLEAAERLAVARPERRVVFCLLSSAGGLFEGQRTVDATSLPAPRRPYGRLKLAQEKMLAASRAPLIRLVYRLTSVFGHISPNHRRGLIPTLVLNGIRHRVSSFSGRMDTLRDFIWVEDVATFVARVALAGGEGRDGETAILASTKPSSLHEIKRLVETVLASPIYVTYSTERTNSADITFSPGVVPRGWQATDLQANVYKLYRRAVGGGAAFDRAFGS